MAIREPDQRASVGLNSRRGWLEIQVDGRRKHQHDWTRTEVLRQTNQFIERPCVLIQTNPSLTCLSNLTLDPPDRRRWEPGSE